MGKIDEKLTEEMTMMIMSPEKQQELDEHILGISRILYEHTEVENLKTFEGIEWELRKQVLEKVTPQINTLANLRRFDCCRNIMNTTKGSKLGKNLG
jgi:hypothetical protein